MGNMQNQEITYNAVGVVGSRVLGGTRIEQSNLFANNDIGTRFNGPIQFNRFSGGKVGIDAQSGQLIAHNILYRPLAIR